MRLLLDTNAFLWFMVGSSRISVQARRLIEDENNERLLSMASLWEIAIKLSLGKLALEQAFDVLFPQQLILNNIGLLGIELGHVAALSNLPLHHRDPFDRLLIAQSIVEQAPIISVDSAFDAYPVQRLW